MRGVYLESTTLGVGFQTICRRFGCTVRSLYPVKHSIFMIAATGETALPPLSHPPVRGTKVGRPDHMVQLVRFDLGLDDWSMKPRHTTLLPPQGLERVGGGFFPW